MPKKILDSSTLEVLAETVCGGGGGSGAAEYSAPGIYRSKSEILSFFARTNVAAKGQSSTRKWFVLESLQGLNQEPDGDIVSAGIERVIARLANPQEYRGDVEILQAVMDHLNKVLRLEGIEIVLDGVRPRLREIQPGVLSPKPKGRVHEPPPNFVSLGVESRLSEILVGRWNEAQRCVDAAVHLSAVIMMGSVLEGVLLSKAEASATVAYKSKAAPKDRVTGQPKRLHEWSLASLIDVAHDVGWLQGDLKRFSHSLRESRNMVHPYFHRTQSDDPDADTCSICWQVVRAAVADLLEVEKASSAFRNA
jgi:hypothetical protein